MLAKENDRFRDTEFNLPTGHHYLGQSVGGETTCHQLSGLNFCFDIGYAPMSATSISNVLISHGHADHSGGMARHATRRHGRKLDPANYYVPYFLEEGARALFEAMRLLEGSPRSGNIIPIGLDTKIPITPTRYAIPFWAQHRIPCFGYLIWEQRKKLKAEYRNLSPDELKALARTKGPNGAKTELSENVIVPDIAFCGDTTIDVLKRQPNVRKARLLLLECTMLEDSVSVADTRRAGHIHLDEIIAQAELFAENECVMLTHFSARYRTNEIRDILDKRLPPELKEKVIPLLPAPR